MNPLIPMLWSAGGVQLLIASANFFAPRKLHYAENLAKVTPMVRQIFRVLSFYIVLTLVAFAALCFTFPADLAGGSTLGRALSSFLALFWGVRVLIQLFYYDPDTKRRHPVFNVLFLTAFVFLTATFTAAALGVFLP